MDDDEEELAMLRSQRKQKLGTFAGATPGELRRRAAEAVTADDDDDDDEGGGPVIVDSADIMSDDIDEALLANFPLSFGKQERTAPLISKVHELTARDRKPKAARPVGGNAAKPLTFSLSSQRVGGGQDACPGGRDSDAAPAALVGPPRPDSGAQRDALSADHAAPFPREAAGLAVGPPRPPAASEASLKGAFGSFGPTGNAVDTQVGPPRPHRVSPAAGDGLMGPPRPPDAADGGSIGPPRPPTATPAAHMVGPPRPPTAAGEAAIGPPRSPGGPAALQGETAGPPRPPGDAFVGPPRPQPPADVADAVAVGPPRLPPGASAHDAVGPPRPTAASAAPLMGPPRPVPRTALGEEAMEPPASAVARDDDDDDDEDDDEDEGPRFPVSNEIVLGGHTRLVSAVAVDPSGSRVLTGGFDYALKMYDFNGMKSDLRPFRELEPHDGHPVVALSFSPTGDAFLCVTGSSQPKIYDRDGHERGEFKRGDMYMRDLKNTRGHVSGCCHGVWHPTDRHTAMTSSHDGTMRVWDTQAIEQKMVIKPTSKPGRVPVTACTYKHDGSLIAAALTDGTVQLWSVTGNFGRSAAVGAVPAPKQQMLAKQTWKYASGASQVLKNAHVAGSEVSDLVFLRDGHTLLSRGADDTLKVWDVRRFKAPVHVWDGLPLSHAQSRLCVSPLQDYVLTGVGMSDDPKAGGAVAFFDLRTHRLVRSIAMPGAVTAVCWNARINHILVGTGDRASGGTHVLYDPTMSEKGALFCVGKAVRAKNPFDFEPAPIIHTPGALPLFRDDSHKKRKRGTESKDPRVPDPGPVVTGRGGGGKLGSTPKTLLTHYLMEKQGLKMLKDQMDPREAILRHKDAADELAPWMKAYAQTQPKRIFAEPEEEEGS